MAGYSSSKFSGLVNFLQWLATGHRNENVHVLLELKVVPEKISEFVLNCAYSKITVYNR